MARRPAAAIAAFGLLLGAAYGQNVFQDNKGNDPEVSNDGSLQIGINHCNFSTTCP